MNAGIYLLFAIAVILLGIYAMRPQKSIVAKSYAPHGGEEPVFQEGPQPPAGESGFGIGMGGGGSGAVDLTEKPPMTACSTLSRKPAAAEAASPELNNFFKPAQMVPTEYNPGKIGDCPPVKPMSSSSRLADIPMCVLAAGP